MEKDDDCLSFDLPEIISRHGLEDHELLGVIECFGTDDSHWIAGGAVRNLLLNKPIKTDVDFFFSSKDAFERFVKEFAPAETLRTDRQANFTYGVKGTDFRIQAISIGFFENAKKCIDSFDYTICQFAIQGDVLVAGKWSLWDLGRSRLVIHKVTYPVATINRLVKYWNHGFGNCKGTIVDILKAVIDDPSLVDQQVMYID